MSFKNEEDDLRFIKVSDNHCKDARGKKEDEGGMAAFGRLFLKQKMFSFTNPSCNDVEGVAVSAVLGSPVLSVMM